MATLDTQFSSAPLGSEQRSQELMAAAQRMVSIPATDIQGTNPVSVPTPPTSSAQTIDQIASETQRQQEIAQRDLDKSKTTFQDRINEITGVMGSREQLEQEAGLDQARLDVSDIRSQIEARELAFRRQVEATQKTAGLSGTQIDRQVRALSRDAARELADLSIIESARLRRFDSISENIDRKIKSKLEPLQFQLQFDQMFYQENRQLLSESQNRAFQIKMLQEDRNYKEKLQEQQDIKRIAEMAYQYGATGEQVAKITDANTWAEAMEAGGSFLGEPFRLQVEAQKFNQYIQQAQLSMQQAQIDAASNAAANALAMEARKMSREDIKLAREDVRVTNFETIQSIKNRVDQELTNVTDKQGNINWEAAAKSNSTIWALANAAGRSQNPEMTRAIGELGLTGTASIEQRVEAMYNKLLKDATANPGKLTEMYRLLNSSHTSAMKDMNDALTSLQTTIPGFEITSTMFVNRDVTADAFVNAAVQNTQIMNAPATQPSTTQFSTSLNNWLYGSSTQNSVQNWFSSFNK
jgi:hypothetical protein